MNAAFVGNESIITPYAKLLQVNLKENNPLKICGVLSSGVESTTNLAIMLNTKAYLSLEALIKDADVIFVCRHDSQLSAFSDVLKEKQVKNKILCHFSTKYDSSILRCSGTNTYYSIGFPYKASVSNTNDILISLEGEGKRSQEFEEVMKTVFPKAVVSTKNEKRLGSIATRVITEYLKIIVNVSEHFYKISGQYDEECFCEFVSKNVKEVISQNPIKKIRKKGENEIRKDMRLLSGLNYSDTKEFYRNMECHIADTGIYTPDEKETILRILKKKY